METENKANNKIFFTEAFSDLMTLLNFNKINNMKLQNPITPEETNTSKYKFNAPDPYNKTELIDLLPN